MELISKFALILGCSIVGTLACAQGRDFAEPARYQQASTEGSGWVNLSYPQGRYFYGTGTDSRTKTPTIVFGKPERQDWQFFSWEEEQALWLLLQDKLAQEVPEKKVAFAKAHSQRNLKWPRVVVRTGEVCVPRLEHSENDDWQEHLTCVVVDLK